jgi:hypothetical protein
MTNSSENKTLLTGQMLQIRDKLMAKRHLIPSSVKSDWELIQQQTAIFDPDLNSQLINHKAANGIKHLGFSGSVDDLMELVESMKNIESKIHSTH